eukprot:COSAG01_NODE_2319_length_7913_cov_82.271052_6_plen_93_part_00
MGCCIMAALRIAIVVGPRRLDALIQTWVHCGMGATPVVRMRDSALVARRSNTDFSLMSVEIFWLRRSSSSWLACLAAAACGVMCAAGRVRVC